MPSRGADVSTIGFAPTGAGTQNYSTGHGAPIAALGRWFQPKRPEDQ